MAEQEQTVQGVPTQLTWQVKQLGLKHTGQKNSFTSSSKVHHPEQSAVLQWKLFSMPFSASDTHLQDIVNKHVLGT